MCVLKQWGTLQLGIEQIGGSKGRELEVGRPAGQLLQDYSPQEGRVRGLGDAIENVKSNPKSISIGQSDIFEIGNALEWRHDADLCN